MAVNTIGGNGRADLRRQLANVMVGGAMAVGAVGRIGGNGFNFAIVHAVASGAFNFTADIAFAARQ